MIRNFSQDFLQKYEKDFQILDEKINEEVIINIYLEND